MDFQLMIDSIPQLLEGAWMTVKLVALALALGICLAIPLALARVSKNPFLWMPVYGFIFVFRGTPLLVQIFIVYYGLGQSEAVRESIFWPFFKEAYWCAIFTFTLNTSAYTAEILRGAIQAVPHGEVEAARALGMPRLLMLRRVVVPRAFRLALPAYGNEIILMLKGSALASTITLLDLTGVARVIVARTFAPYELFIMAAIMYLALTLLIVRALKYAEWRLSPHLRPPRHSK
ncbi:MAG: ABC transporter permease [Rhodospirillaceae bacterium]|nr:ABC transporter permease [Rhodospirillaceae bacterium]MBT3927385.1 ABC transporter permease [Rhodospirillaceae bacterium]MBT4425658.1 ABC transporter permease [Rhodospirillaceae bacterium]MBT5039728.1 ABC transporter permease [Rhodospirillaceae bacterium]MBT5677827.1 ABC transporter permease [Rhodospirillaceae bacterium]